MKIVDLRCAVIGRHPIVRIVTDENIHGLGEVEFTKPYIKPWVLHFREALIGEDPTDVERVMLKIRQRGSFKPYGAAVSAIEHALWDIAGKAANVPTYKFVIRCAATMAIAGASARVSGQRTMQPISNG
jgi:L-alanine-DL-glutamate epimerase-like enolase superfamily enzyme